MSAVAVREEQEKNRFFCLNDSYSSTRDWILSTILRTLVLFYSIILSTEYVFPVPVHLLILLEFT